MARKSSTCCRAQRSKQRYGEQITLPAGASAINPRDVAHAGLKVLGTTPFKYLAVHVADKGAKLYDDPPK